MFDTLDHICAQIHLSIGFAYFIYLLVVNITLKKSTQLIRVGCFQNSNNKLKRLKDRLGLELIV